MDGDLKMVLLLANKSFICCEKLNPLSVTDSIAYGFLKSGSKRTNLTKYFLHILLSQAELSYKTFYVKIHFGKYLYFISPGAHHTEVLESQFFSSF